MNPERATIKMSDNYLRESHSLEGNFDIDSSASRVQLILSEKRTWLSLMRTGISILALPMAVASALIATSKYYETSEVLLLFIPIMILNAFLVILGLHLIFKSLKHIKHQDHLLLEIKRSHPELVDFVD